MAYTTATLKSKDVPFPDGRVRILITFTGNAGEPPIDRDLIVDESTTVASLRRWAYDEAGRLGSRKTIIDLLTPGAAITLTAPPAPPAPTAEQVWLEKAHRLARAKALGLTADAAEEAALEAEVNATYDAAYFAKL